MKTKYVFSLFLILLKLFNSEILRLIPGEKHLISDMRMNSERLFKIYFKDLIPNSRYQINSHFLGALGYYFKYKIICDNIYMKDIEKKDLKLNNMDSMIINTNNNGMIKDYCSDDYENNFFLISITLTSKAYQFKEENEIIGSFLIEIINYPKRKYLTKIINYKLYNGIGIILLIFICIILFKNSLRKFLFELFDEKENKSN